MKNGMNLNDLMYSLGGRTDSKLGYTTTVKQQVDDIEVKIKLTLGDNRSFQKIIRVSKKVSELDSIPVKKALRAHKDIISLIKQINKRTCELPIIAIQDRHK